MDAFMYGFDTASFLEWTFIVLAVVLIMATVGLLISGIRSIAMISGGTALLFGAAVVGISNLAERLMLAGVAGKGGSLPTVMLGSNFTPAMIVIPAAIGLALIVIGLCDAIGGMWKTFGLDYVGADEDHYVAPKPAIQHVSLVSDRLNDRHL